MLWLARARVCLCVYASLSVCPSQPSEYRREAFFLLINTSDGLFLKLALARAVVGFHNCVDTQHNNNNDNDNGKKKKSDMT